MYRIKLEDVPNKQTVVIEHAQGGFDEHIRHWVTLFRSALGVLGYHDDTIKEYIPHPEE